ncbi:stealth family protein [Nocardiopsis sp. RSe5-2]|uniref:Stealth family protein n=1 Tax=Nocardiopsis endophytica TaxID=3018445 RepID=A0ABT4U3Y8_9ACTN|nr:stealth family protein [Nocardiopsis endophytica]MDA2811650.1 stealth family protein [Nocardiopsis endophytica]
MGVTARITRAGKRLLPPNVRTRIEERRRREREAAAKHRRAERKAAEERDRAERIVLKRRALLASDQRLRTFTGPGGQELIGRLADSFTSREASAHNLRLVTEAAVRAGADYFLVPGRSRTRHAVGLRRADKKAFLEAMRALYGGASVYAAKPAPGGALAAGPALYAEGALPGEVKKSSVIRFGRHLLGPDGRLLSGLEHGCDVEFWRDGESFPADGGHTDKYARLRVQAPKEVLASSWVAPRRNQVADVLPADQRIPATRLVDGREHPTFAPFTRLRPDQVAFPVDAVFTWVDGDDPVLAADRERHRGRSGVIAARETGASRYTDRDELRYALRSLHTYAPFIRHVYIVTDRQRPSWLDTSAGGISVVDHRDVFADPSVLPVFNSHAIGTQLHHIPGLSERYLYLNDDVFFGRTATAEDFFHANGIARLPFSPFQFGLGEPHPEEPAPNSAGKNARRLVEAEHGRFITNKFKHVPHPQIREVMGDLERTFAEEVAATAASRFRSTGDIGMAATLHHHHALLTGRGVPARYRLRYVDVGADDARDRLEELRTRRGHDFFCLNDVDTPPERREEVDTMVRGFLEEYFPFPSPWEKEGTR